MKAVVDRKVVRVILGDNRQVPGEQIPRGRRFTDFAGLCKTVEGAK